MGAAKGTNNGHRKMQPADSLKNPSKERLAQEDKINRVQARLVDISTNPPSLLKGKDARRLWREIVPQLKQANLVKQLDQSNVTILCTFYQVWVTANEDIINNGTWDEATNKKRASYNVMLDAATHIERISRELGLTYASRAGLIGNSEENNEAGKPAQATSPVDMLRALAGGKE